jgi:hypothetical protein
MRLDIFRANPPWTSSKLLCANDYTTTIHGGPTPMDKDGIIELSGKASCLHPVFGPPFTHYPLFQWYPKSNEILSNLSMKCWNSGFNPKGSIIIVVVHVAAVEALKKKERQDENQFTNKIAGILSFCPAPATPFNANVLFCRFFFNQSHPVYD